MSASDSKTALEVAF